MGSPIILDLGGNGFNLTSATDGVAFDLSPNGIAERIAWTARNADDAWLVLDRDGNGTIDNGTEMFGNFTPQPKVERPHGYLALAVYDENGDQRIDASDSIYTSLRLWRDANHNGVSESEELTTLASQGVLGLSTQFQAHRKVDPEGNLFRYSALVYREIGSRVGPRSFDVFLLTEALVQQAHKQGSVSKTGLVSLATLLPCTYDPCASGTHCGFPLCNKPVCKVCPTTSTELFALKCKPSCVGYQQCSYQQFEVPPVCTGVNNASPPQPILDCTTP